MVWQSKIHVSGASAAHAFDIADMSGGCGNAHFYANTTGTYSYDANTPDPTVLSSCENYGLHNGADGKDLTTPYTNAMTDTLTRSPSMTRVPHARRRRLRRPRHELPLPELPGPGTAAKNDDGTPMHNWWVYLFY